MAKLQKDLREFVESLLANGVEFLVVGAHAMAFYERPRFTQDIDFYVSNVAENARRIVVAIKDFGFGSLELSEDDFEHPDRVVQLGMAPNRIDLLTKIDGVSFEDAWKNRVEGEIDGLCVNFISLEDLKRNKRASGRKQDLADLEALDS